MLPYCRACRVSSACLSLGGPTLIARGEFGDYVHVDAICLALKNNNDTMPWERIIARMNCVVMNGVGGFRYKMDMADSK